MFKHPKTNFCLGLIGIVNAVAFCGAFVGDGEFWRSTGMSRMQRGLWVGCQMKQIARERVRGE